jgi:hypothetical protein
LLIQKAKNDDDPDIVVSFPMIRMVEKLVPFRELSSSIKEL